MNKSLKFEGPLTSTMYGRLAQYAKHQTLEPVIINFFTVVKTFDANIGNFGNFVFIVN